MRQPDYAALYADADEMTNHWWWRPGWQVGTRFYAWHITLDGHDDLHRLIDHYQAALAQNSHLDAVPRQWRHITMTGIGRVEDVTGAQLNAVIERVTRRLTDFTSITSTFQRAAIFPEAVALPPHNPETFTRLQNAAQSATAEVLATADAFNPRFRAHASVHYSNSDQPAKPVRAALDNAAPAPATATFTTLDLIRMHRDNRMYEWTIVDSVPLA